MRALALAFAILGSSPLTSIRWRLQAAAQEDSVERTTVGGYGEVHYTNATGADTPGEVNVRRFVVYLAHTFSERIAFRSELEVEDAKIEGGEDGGEVALEQLYLDYTLSPAATIRAGLVLPPIGIVNETHEPPTFNGVERPAFDQNVIPATWRDIGVGLVGTLPGSSGINYRVYPAQRAGRQRLLRRGRDPRRTAGGQGGELRQPVADRSARVGPPGSPRRRLVLVRRQLRRRTTALGTGTFDNAVALVSADARYDIGPFMFRGVVANVSIADAEEINAAYGGQVGSRIAGGYVEGAYNLLAGAGARVPHRLERLPSPRALQHAGRRARPAWSGTTRWPAGSRPSACRTSRCTTWSSRATTSSAGTGPGVGEDEQLALGVGYQF